MKSFRFLSVCALHIFLLHFSTMHEKNDFAEVSKNLARYRLENNFVGPSK